MQVHTSHPPALNGSVGNPSITPCNPLVCVYVRGTSNQAATGITYVYLLSPMTEASDQCRPFHSSQYLDDSPIVPSNLDALVRALHDNTCHKVSTIHMFALLTVDFGELRKQR